MSAVAPLTGRPPRRVAYILAAALLVSVFYFLNHSPGPQGRRQRPDHIASKWQTADTFQHPVPQDASEEKPALLAETHAEDDKQGEAGTTGFNEAVFSFQGDLTDYFQPHGLESYSNLPPLYLDPKSKHQGNTFATYLCTRNSSIYDPYFLATEQLVFRSLWKPESRTREGHPFTVFVAPFIEKEQRDLLKGAGANVVELPLIDWKPTVEIFARWRDLFSKLHMWDQLQFDLIAFMDSDVFPLKPLDDIFTDSQKQKCNKALIEHPEDKKNEDELCDFTFSGVKMMYIDEINVGTTVFNPNKAMHQRLVRESSDSNNFDNNLAEQAFLNKYFSKKGPFPMHFIERKYNGFWANEEEEDRLWTIHEKLWAFTGNAKWAEGMFRKTHDEMTAFYQTEEFRRKRKNGAGKQGKSLI